MKNFLAPVFKNKAFQAVTKFYVDHETTILTGGTIGFGIATTAVVYKNSPIIHNIIDAAKEALAELDPDDENYEDDKKEIYRMALKDLVKPVTEIVIFQGAQIVTAMLTKKNSDKKDAKIAELAGAVSMAQQAVHYYQEFHKEAEEELGEKKLNKIHDEMSKKAEPIYCELNPSAGEQIFRDPYSGRAFVCTEDRIKLACERMSKEVRDYDEANLNGEYYQTLGLDDTALGEQWGYAAENESIEIYYHKSLVDISTPNGNRAGYDIYLIPEPVFLDK